MCIRDSFRANKKILISNQALIAAKKKAGILPDIPLQFKGKVNEFGELFTENGDKIVSGY